MKKMESKPDDEKKSSGPDLTEKLLKTRTLTLFDEISSQTAKQFIQSLLIMETDDNKAPIKVLLNSPGGEVNSGFAIYDAIRFVEPEIKIICTGLCASIATIILTAVKKENRLSLPNCEFLIHQPLSSGITGRISDIEIASREIIKTKEKLTSILAKETGKSLDQVKQDCDRDYWMSANDAKEYGLISKIIQSRIEV
jgi:ATP-dependent Clp protease protease subunit